MEYDAVASKERLTGRAFFFETGATGQIDLGNVQLMNLDYAVKRKEHYKARGGKLTADRFDAYSVEPKWEITGDEFASALYPEIFLSTAPAILSQTIQTTNQTMSFSVHVGGVFNIGIFGLTAASVTGGTEGIGADYVIDRGLGKIYIPYSTTFVENTSKTLNYQCPQVNWWQILPPLTTLNKVGTMQVFEEDEYTTVPKTIHNFAVSLSNDSGGQTKVDDYKTFKMIATITDPANWIILKRQV
jgi:hypothetical protein